nr:prostamide/prostaglandin F synthase-like [Lytechinus pictus]
MDSRNIGDNIIENVETGETTKLSSLWSESACVIQFLRRFGCPVCRMGSRDLTHLKPRLDAANVRMVAIGMEETGAKEFLESGFWKGELYIDRQKKIYGVLNFERYTFMTIIACLFTKRSREAISKNDKNWNNLPSSAANTKGMSSFKEAALPAIRMMQPPVGSQMI